MNLLEDAWIPVRRAGGTVERIAPWQLTDRIHEDPFAMIAAPRPDFNGALLEFLVGVLQTEAPPEDRRGWVEWQRDPPGPQELHRRLERAVPWFELDGEGPGFMQSLEPFQGKEKPIGELLMDDPPSETLKKNTDHFIKRGRIRGLCPACTAAALYGANAYSPAGGRGHRTSLRGGGPVTTLVVPDPATDRQHSTLWHLCWLNVLPRRIFEEAVPGNPARTEPAATYPWLASTRTSEHDELTTPEDMSPYHVFWGMPRRIRLDQQHRDHGACDLCSREELLFTGFTLRHGGMNYAGAHWRHPLTPHRFSEAGEPSALHMPRGGLGYRDWAWLVTGEADRKGTREPSVVAAAAVRDRHRVHGRARLFAFGYDVDNAKVRGWYEYLAPVYQLEAEERRRLGELASSMIAAASEVAGNLRSALKSAWNTDGSPEFAVATFWQKTEPAFLQLLDRLLPVLGDDEGETGILHRWHGELCRASEELFETWAEAEDVGAVDPGRVARAHLELRRWNWKRKIRDALRLPETTKRRKGGTAS